MPKAKTNKTLAKRFKLTGTGKLLRRQKGRRHLLTKKSARRKRRLEHPTLVSESFVAKFKRMITGL